MGTAFAVIAFVVLGTFAWGAVRGAPWVPTWKRDVARIVAIADPKPSDCVADLGCGTGGVLAAFVASGCRVRGWELALIPWCIATLRLRAGASVIRFGDFWNADLTDVDIIYAFLTPRAHARLAEKLRHGLRAGTRIVTYVWPLPGWHPVRVDECPGSPPLYLYCV